jgi:hypothetical protein
MRNSGGIGDGRSEGKPGGALNQDLKMGAQVNPYTPLVDAPPIELIVESPTAIIWLGRLIVPAETGTVALVPPHPSPPSVLKNTPDPCLLGGYPL